MTRTIIYGATLLAVVAASAMTLTSIIIPRWISRDIMTSSSNVHYTYGLHRRCSSTSGTCTHFPQYEDCHGEDRYFCSMWRSIGFLMSFAILLEGMILVAYGTILIGGRQKRETGWKILSFLLVLAGVVQCASMALAAFLYNDDPRFAVDWRLDTSWVLCTISWSICELAAAVICISGLLLPPEDGYEPLRNYGHVLM